MAMQLPLPQELIRAGVHVGHVKSKWNPQMAPFVFGVRNNIHIIDVYRTMEQLEAAIEFLSDIRRRAGTILFVGVKIQSRDSVKECAEKLESPYVVGRWIGGLFTNFSVVKKRLAYLRELEEMVVSEDIEKYAKKEQLSFKRQLAKLDKELGGIKQLSKLPDALVVSDVVEERTAILEARKMKIPVVGLVDTDGDPAEVKYPIPTNTSARAALQIIYSTLGDSLASVAAAPETRNEEERPLTEEAQKKIKEAV